MSFIPEDLLKDVKNELDEILKFQGIAEVVDGVIINFALGYVNDKYADEIPVKFQDEIVLLLEAFVAKDYDMLSEAVSSAIDEIVDLPFADDDATATFLAMNIKMLKDFIYWFANK